jgi:hypothetical protein
VVALKRVEKVKKGWRSNVRKIRSLAMKSFVDDDRSGLDDSFRAKEISLRKRL